MSRYVRKEDEADKWLREHDPYYLDTTSSKSRKISNPYETPKQEARRRDLEIPFCSLSYKQSLEINEKI